MSNNLETGQFNPEAIDINSNPSEFRGNMVSIPEGETKMDSAVRIARILSALEGQEQ